MIFIILLLIAALLYVTALLFKQQKEHAEELTKKVAFAREDSVKKSRSTINGAIIETLAPLLPGWPYNGRDATHVGSPLDFIVFNGMSQYRDEGTGQIEVVLIDVKTGNAQLTPVEKAIKEACEEGRVRWETLRFNEERQGLLPVKHRKSKKKIEEAEIISLDNE